MKSRKSLCGPTDSSVHTPEQALSEIQTTLKTTDHMDFDNSVSLTTDRVLNITSELGPEEFAAKVLAAVPSDVKSGNLGCGRILADYSIMIQTRYVLCDIYEEGPENLEDSDKPIGKNADSAAITDKVNAAVPKTENGTPTGPTRQKYRIELKYGKMNSRIADILYCGMFLAAFWFAGNMTIFTGILAALLVIAAGYLLISSARYKFGKKQCEVIAESIEKTLEAGSTPESGRA